MPDQADVVFDDSPVFRLAPDAAQQKTSAVAWFASPKVLDSGRAWGQEYLQRGAACVAASVGREKVILLGPEVACRGQPHGTFKLLFNAVQWATTPGATASAVSP